MGIEKSYEISMEDNRRLRSELRTAWEIVTNREKEIERKVKQIAWLFSERELLLKMFSLDRQSWVVPEWMND